MANIDNIQDYIPFPPLEAGVRNITPQNYSFTSGFDRGRCVITAICEDPELLCAWMDKMYDPFQAPQNNWGTYGEECPDDAQYRLDWIKEYYTPLHEQQVCVPQGSDEHRGYRGAYLYPA